MAQDPEIILRNSAAYVPKHLHRAPGLNPEQIVAQQITEGTRKRVSDVGVFALQVVQGFINRGTKPNVAIDRVQFENHRRHGKVEIGREFVGRGWIIEEHSPQWVKESTDTNVGDYSIPKPVPAYWRPVSGSCLLQDGTIGAYTGYPPRGSGNNPYFPSSNRPDSNPYGDVAIDFRKGAISTLTNNPGLLYAHEAPAPDESYNAAILAVCGVDRPEGVDVPFDVIEQFQLADGWRNKLEEFASVA